MFAFHAQRHYTGFAARGQVIRATPWTGAETSARSVSGTDFTTGGRFVPRGASTQGSDARTPGDSRIEPRRLTVKQKQFSVIAGRSSLSAITPGPLDPRPSKRLFSRKG